MKLTELTDEQYEKFTIKLAETVVDAMDYKTMDSILVNHLKKGYQEYSKEDLYIELCEWMSESTYDNIISKVTED